MAKGAVGSLIFFILLVLFFVLPIVPYTFASASVFGLVNVQVTATVSLSYAMFQCGYVSNPTITGTFLSFSGSYTNPSSGFYCGNQ
jgi:hypothetical protein